MQNLHINDRKELAKQLNLSVDQFDKLVKSANRAHDTIVEMGPFYGPEDSKEPTFRITAEPIHLPHGSKEILTTLGSDLLQLGRCLPKLPDKYKKLLGDGMDYRVPLSWRIDTIINNSNIIQLNEVEGIDSVSALMMAEQLAYGLQEKHETTLSRFVSALRILFPEKQYPSFKIAIIRNLQNNPFTPNAKRFIEFLGNLSDGTIQCDLYDIGELQSNIIKPKWEDYVGILNEAYCSPHDLQMLGIRLEQILSAGNYHPLVNKGLFALVHSDELYDFWEKELGKDCIERLKTIMIPTEFVTSVTALHKARKDGRVVKVSWAEGNQIIINRVKGVAIAQGDIEENQNERWNLLEEYFHKGYTIIAQDYVEPAKISAYLRKKSTNLEEVEWYNRICVKYVVGGNPNGQDTPPVYLTATEVTLGPEIIPAGRKCAFTAGTF